MIDLLIEDPGTVGGWLSLEQPDRSLYLGADTFANSAMTLKRITASNAYVPGTYTVRVTPDNTMEIISVYITDDNMARRRDKTDYLVALFTRTNYPLMLVMEGRTEMLTGQAADYQINNQREFLHAGVTLITFNVPVLPTRKVVGYTTRAQPTWTAPPIKKGLPVEAPIAREVP